MLPVLCDPKRRGEADACVVKYDQVKDIIRTTKERWVGGRGGGRIHDVGSGIVGGWVVGG